MKFKAIMLKLIALICVVATLLPLIVACDNDPDDGDKPNPDDETDTPTGGEYLSASVTSYNKTPLLSFSNEEFLKENTHLKTTYKSGKTAIALEPSQGTYSLSFTVPKGYRDINDYSHIELAVYSEAATGETITLSLYGAGSVSFDIDFSGWRNFRIQIDSITVKNPTPEITGVAVSVSSDYSGTVYFTEISATLPVYTLSVPDGVDINDASLYRSVIGKYNRLTIGYEGASQNDEYTQRIKDIEDTCAHYYDWFQRTKPKVKAKDTLFGITVDGNDPASGYQERVDANANELYNYIYYMARGWGAIGSSFYHNEQLLEDLKYCLEYGYDYFYGEHIVETGKTYGNWWGWDIGTPLALCGTLCILYDELDYSLVQKYLKPFDTIVPYPTGAACNLVDMGLNVVLSSALQKDALRLCSALDMVSVVFKYVDDYEEYETLGDGGFYTDGSYLQHDHTPYAGAYGNNLLTAISTIMYVTADSGFELQGELVNNQYEWVMNSFRPFIYGSSFMAFLGGRNVSRNITEKSNLASIMVGVIKISTYAPEPYRTQLRSLIRYAMDNSDTDYTANVPLPFIDYCIELKADDTVPALEALNETIIYGRMDRAVQHTPDYAVGISLSSTRIYKYESINTENKAGWYHGDGMIYIYTDCYDYGKEFFWYADPYLMPGTTVSNGKRTLTCITPSVFNSSPYAGGVSQGKYGAVGFILGYPSNASAFENQNAKNIKAKKSYFMFDNEIVCIGSDIYDNSGVGARTVVENRLWRSDDTLSINGNAVSSPATVETEIDARTMHFTNMGGYVFLGGNQTILYQKATNSYNGTRDNTPQATGTRDFLEISISHGSSGVIENGKYMYVYLPEATVEETESYSASPDVEVIAVKNNCHAVLEKKLGIVAANIFEIDTEFNVKNASAYTGVTKVSAETEASVMIVKNADGSYTVSVSDPTQLNRNTVLSISITGITQVVSKDDAVSKCEIEDGTLNITVNTQNAVGKTFNLTVR